MRKFIISDIHGDGNVYNSVMGYLDNISKNEEVTLYINGDLIDRGGDSAFMLLDVINRIRENRFKIIYLGGNHELMMYQYFSNRREYFRLWYRNGGRVTEDGLYNLLDSDEKLMDVVHFISNLKIYQKFGEKINGKNIVLVHAACPEKVKDECDLTIKDDNSLVSTCVWNRDMALNNNSYFSIIGHSPNNNVFGYCYDKKSNTFNIDGGCSRYVNGLIGWDHVPLVEVFDKSLKILTFNNNNEIIYGNYFDGEYSDLISNHELEKDRSYLNKNIKVKKLVRTDKLIW